MSVLAKNPILSGFYPDPSICAVGDDYYIVNSSFAYFPGLPIMHSKDLANWEQIGNVLDRNSQLPLNNADVSQGLFAPTIRYNEKDKLFYVICTNVSYGGNFIVTAEKPEGPWSEPHYIEGADGIDPSLFFDSDGKCYYIGTHPNPEGCKYNGDWYIYIQEIDIKNFKLVGEHKNVWNGAMKGVHWPEGPHLYKIGEYYYILHAEGGTGPEHAISVARSKNVFGPYENNFCNPIFTHRHLGTRYPIKYVGHGDMFQTSNGDWYIVMLAVRPIKGYTTMGRETFLARVFWENDWPVVNPGVGILTSELKINLDESIPKASLGALPGKGCKYNFPAMSMLGPEFMTLRNPSDDMYYFAPGKGLMLKCSTDTINEKKNASYLAIRQDSHAFKAVVTLYTDNLYMGVKAGMTLFQNNEYNVRFEVSNARGHVILTKGGEEKEIASCLAPNSPTEITFLCGGLNLSIFTGSGSEEKCIASDIDLSSLSTEVAGGFVGCTIGIYATDEETREEPVYACFESFSYDGLLPVNLKD